MFAAVVALLVGVAVSGIGGPAGAQENQIVKIGVLAPLETGLTEFGLGIRNGVQLAIDQANNKNAIPGWTIELVPVDDSSEPTVGAANVPTLTNDPEVLGVVGTYNSGVAAEVLPLMEPEGLALVSPGNTLADLSIGPDRDNPERQFDNYFRLVASDADQAPFLAKAAKKLGHKTAAVVSETKAVSQGLADAFVESFTSKGGTVDVQMTVPDGAGAEDFTDFINAAKSSGCDLIFFGGEYEVAATLRTAASAAGLTEPLMGGDGIKDDAYIETASDDAKGSLASTVGVPAEKLKTAKKFFKAYDKAGFEDAPSDFGPYAYDAANITIAAIKKVLKGQDAIPEEARAQVVSNLQKTKAKGVTGKIRFDEFGDTKNVVFTLYRVGGDPLEWVPIKP